MIKQSYIRTFLDTYTVYDLIVTPCVESQLAQLSRGAIQPCVHTYTHYSLDVFIVLFML